MQAVALAQAGDYAADRLPHVSACPGTCGAFQDVCTARWKSRWQSYIDGRTIRSPIFGGMIAVLRGQPT